MKIIAKFREALNHACIIQLKRFAAPHFYTRVCGFKED
jgi:hypothetical protein